MAAAFASFFFSFFVHFPGFWKNSLYAMCPGTKRLNWNVKLKQPPFSTTCHPYVVLFEERKLTGHAFMFPLNSLSYYNLLFCPQMSSFSTRALTLLSSVFGACGLLLVGVAVSTDYWLLMEEGIVLHQNQTTEVKMALHSGLWRVCFVAGSQQTHSFPFRFEPVSVEQIKKTPH